MIQFKKVSFEQFQKDVEKCYTLRRFDKNELEKLYDEIELPKRSTVGSAGYDFFMPLPHIRLFANRENSVIIPTGICCFMPTNVVLQLYPRSGLGFKYGMQIDNTVGIIDSDYSHSDNEGHIMVKVSAKEDMFFERGKGFVQGVFTNFLLTDDDESSGKRNGGFGSTD